MGLLVFLGYFGCIAPSRVAGDDSPEFTAADIGDASLAGGSSFVTGGVDVTGGGRDIGGNSDQFHFCHRPQMGDFDLAVQVQAVDNSDVWAKAGLMVRESLEPDSPFAAALATPNLSGCLLQARASAGANSVFAGTFPVNYPFTWLRLKRAGDLFSGYASMDGQNWRLLGTNVVAMTNTVFFGLAVTSHNTNQLATAEFRNLSEATGSDTAGWPTDFESLGPSSRRTGLVIAEIMYHPAPRADGRDLEFIELFNANPFFEDISGYRLTGEVDFAFPVGTVLPGGGFIVVARTPADVKSVYGIANVAGPYANSLKRSGTLRLRDKTDAILLEVPYSNRPPWPVAADGTGHSLVLARPSYGEGSAQAWAASGLKGGSPGRGDGVRLSPLGHVRINELLASAADPKGNYIELYNHSSQAADLSGCYLSDDPVIGKFKVPSGTTIPAGAFVHFTQDQLGFGLDAAGGTVFLTSPDQTAVLEAVRFDGQAKGTPTGRGPDGSTEFYPLAGPTPGTANSKILEREVVINELMYHPLSGNEDYQYVELYNQGDRPVNLGGWKFVDGIEFTFSSAHAIPARGYLVVAKDAAHLLATYPDLSPANTVGNFAGKLSGGGERVALAMPEAVVTTSANQPPATNTNYVVVDEVTYGTGGRWGTWADGGGSSLELVDARSNHRLAPTWADSDETAKSEWTTIEATGVLDNGAETIDSLHVVLLGEGECLLDDVEVYAAGSATNLIANPTFESGLTGWVPLGNHVRSSLETSGGYSSSQSLHIRASGRGDTGANRIRTPLRSSSALRPGQTATIRAKVRWLRGFPELVLRLKGNYLEATGQMALPKELGTPGARNSRTVPNSGPAIYEVSHNPSLPAANEPAAVTARVQDVDGLSDLVLKYRVDPSTNWIALPMADDGTGGDAVAADGIYSATIPGQKAGTLVAFHIQATDGSTAPATSLFPAEAPVRECLVRFGEPIPASSFGTYRLWLSAATVAAWNKRPVLSNEELDGTFVYGNQRVIYNMGSRYSGSPWHQSVYSSPLGGPCTYAMTMPKDDLLLGTTSFNKLHAPGNTPGDDGTIQCEQTAYWMVRQLGLPWNYQRYVNVFVNGLRRGTLMEDTQVPGSEVISERFPNDPEGDLFKLNGWYEFDNATAGTMPHTLESWCTLNDYTTTGGAKKLARYRWSWSPRAEHGTANNYANVFALVDAANTPASGSYTANMEALVDMEQWLRTFAIEHAVGNWDSFGNRNAQNMYAYKPTQDKWKLLIWDFNIVLGNSGSDGPSNDDLFQINYADRGMARIYNEPAFRRTYLRNLQEIAANLMVNAKVDPILDAKYAAFKANGLTVSAPSSIKNWISARRKYLVRYMTNVTATFAVTSNQGTDFSTNQNWFALTGTAPIDVKTITVNDQPYPVVWDTWRDWRIVVPLNAQTNPIAVQGYDVQGNPMSNAVGAITVTFTGTIERPQDHVVINEVMYHAPLEGAAFVELVNTSTRSAFDLSNHRLRGVDFTFTPGTMIGPGGYLVVVKDRAVFAAVYGKSIPIAGEFNGRLDQTGETLQLVKPGAIPAEEVVLDEVTYSANPPWPAGASGTGASLQLLDPNLDNALGYNWTTTNPELAVKPEWKFVSVTGTAASSQLLLYHSPYQAPPDPRDLSGRWMGGMGSPGSFYQMTVEFKRDGTNNWAGTFFGQDLTCPLGIIRYTNSNVSFYLPNIQGVQGNPRWSGKLSADGQVISGTFAQDTPNGTQTLPFSLQREVDPTLIWGGDLYIDDLKLVAGNTPAAGPNLVRNGDFEAPLDGTWNVSTNNAASVISTAVKRSGNASLHLVASLGGADLESAIWQDTTPLAPGATYTLSYWYLPSTNGVDLTVRVLDDELASTHSILPDKPATPGAKNSVSDGPPEVPPVFLTVFINEWLASNTQTLADPADGQFEDWFELYNPGPATADLSGYFLTDTAANKTKWRIPAGTRIPPKGFLLVWADEDTGQNGANGDLHVNFKLSQNGEEIGLVAPDGAIVDWVAFGQQTADVSQGRWPDGQDGPLQFMRTPTPGAPNVLANDPAVAIKIDDLAVLDTGVISIRWLAQPGQTYQAQFKDSLSDAGWSDLGQPVHAGGNTAEVSDSVSAATPHRFYRVVLVE